MNIDDVYLLLAILVIILLIIVINTKPRMSKTGGNPNLPKFKINNSKIDQDIKIFYIQNIVVDQPVRIK